MSITRPCPTRSGRSRLVALLALLTPATLAAQVDPPTSLLSNESEEKAPASKFYLNYDVPESPAFNVLGVTPAKVLRGAAAKPVVINLLSQIASSERVGTGIAIDVAPHAYFTRFRNVNEYNTPANRFLSGITVSVASVQGQGDTAAVRMAVGVRLTLKDDHDLLRNTKLAEEVSRLLVPTAIDCPKIPGTNICQAGVRTAKQAVDVSKANDDARTQVWLAKGWGVSAGAALGGSARGGIFSSDSVTDGVGRAWLSAARYLGSGHEALFTAQWARDTARTNRLLGGIAYRHQTGTSALAAEVAYDSHARKLVPGVNAEFQILQRVTLVTSLLTEAPDVEGGSSRLRFRTALRWAGTEGF